MSSGTSSGALATARSCELRVDGGECAEQLGREAGGRLGCGDLLHLGDVAPRLRRRPADRRARALRIGGARLREVAEHGLEDAVRMCGAEGLRQDRDTSLVHRCGTHLHRRGRADDVRHDHTVDTLQWERSRLGRSRPGEVDAGRPSRTRRRPGDRAVHGVDPGRRKNSRDAEDDCRADGVEVDDQGTCRTRTRGDLRRDVDRGTGRENGEDDVGLPDERLERADVLEPDVRRQPPCPFAASGEGNDHVRAAVPQPRSERAAHCPGRDDPDDVHAGRIPDAARVAEPRHGRRSVMCLFMPLHPE